MMDREGGSECVKYSSVNVMDRLRDCMRQVQHCERDVQSKREIACVKYSSANMTYSEKVHASNTTL